MIDVDIGLHSGAETKLALKRQGCPRSRLSISRPEGSTIVRLNGDERIHMAELAYPRF